MKKVVLLGDSIRAIGYGKVIPDRLSGEFEVWQPSENCRFAKYTLRGLWDWKDGIEGADIIHWNNGLWDISDLFGDGVFTPMDEYISTMLRVARLLKERAEIVIFATTTPVRNENAYNKNRTIASYNNALVPLLEKMGIVINDLYTPIATDPERYICDDKIHLSEEGIALASDMVETIIRREAKKLGGSKKQASPQPPKETGAPI